MPNQITFFLHSKHIILNKSIQNGLLFRGRYEMQLLEHGSILSQYIREDDQKIANRFERLKPMVHISTEWNMLANAIDWLPIFLPPLESQWSCCCAPIPCRHSWIWTDFAAEWLMPLLDSVVRTYFPWNLVPTISQSSMTQCSRPMPANKNKEFDTKSAHALVDTKNE